MQCSNCGASTPGGRCPYCGHAGAAEGPGAAAPGASPYASTATPQPTAMDADYRAAMRQPTANDADYRAAMGQPTANDPQWQAAMGQPQTPYGAAPQQPSPNPYARPMPQGPSPIAKKGCCGCLSVMTVALSVLGALAWAMLH
jgi:hypothetical protein